MKADRDATATAAPVVTTPIWHHALAGGVSGAGARILTAPLDLLKIRLQLNTKAAAAISPLPPSPAVGGRAAALPNYSPTSITGVFQREGIRGVSWCKVHNIDCPF